MGFKQLLGRSSIVNYGRSIREAPREVICNRPLLLSSLIYALAGVPMSESSMYMVLAQVR